ncbi:MAG: oxygenase MpaB family protein, partial [Actinomycetota bacterium]
SPARTAPRPSPASTPAPSRPHAVTHLRGERAPEVLADVLAGAGGLVAGANIVMQLANLKVGHGVAESRVDSGALYKHPIKRARTTFGYVGIALFGTDEEREVLAHEVTEIHKRVKNLPGESVRYTALDPELQLWVAACIYKGMEDAHRIIHGPPSPELLEVLYPHAARLATTLQVPAEMWPEDREAFEAYWEAEMAAIEMDDVTRGYLWDFASLGFLWRPIPQLLGPLHRIIVAGSLPAPFRRALRLPWGQREQRVYGAAVSATRAVHRVVPKPILKVPLKAYLWDMQRRIGNHRDIL